MATLTAENRPSGKMRQMLDRLKAVGGVHEDSLAAVLNLVNPFPDYPAQRVGWPDSMSGASVVMVDLWEETITNPSGMNPGETWDVAAYMLPFAFGPEGVGPCTLSPPVSTAGSEYDLDPVSIYTKVSGSSPFPLFTANPQYTYNYAHLAQSAPFRIVAQGLEIVNTSADLYRGGSAYAYRFTSPVDRVSGTTQVAPGGVLAVTKAFDATVLPPVSPDQVNDWPNTYIGDAREGVYVINTPVGIANPPRIMTTADVAFFNDINEGDGASTPGFRVRGGGGHTGWNIAGAFMTGLAQNSSLLVKHRIYLEVFPVGGSSSASDSLVRLSSLTTPYSPMIMEVLAQVLRDMPAGCAYTENPLGEWFSSILKHVEALAPKIGAMIPLPGAGLIGQGIGALAGHVRGPVRSQTPVSVAPASSKAVVRAPAKKKVNARGALTAKLLARRVQRRAV